MSDDESRGSRKRAPAPLGDAVSAWLSRTGIGARVAQAAIIVEWPRLVGEQIASVTEAESITPDGLLRVRVATAAWANELSLMTPQIIARLNAGRQGRIRGIRWIAAGPGTRPLP
jgi:predicted nucleic acid-binding Zn ribbon protein